MAAMHKQLAVALSDLRFIAIECPHCKTRVTLDMQNLSDHAKRHGVFAPAQCPGCATPYDSAMRPGVDGFQRSYTELLKIADRVMFYGEPESTKP